MNIILFKGIIFHVREISTIHELIINYHDNVFLRTCTFYETAEYKFVSFIFIHLALTLK